ncbi:hypothetical protein ATL39_3263 [Sinobaca qinghaiensis]|uniref:Uncharacterized protein n=1 Tax=Sinobaca qinghaiensis TaxID=342944 RepID=A0A419UW49_9BACL|nr:hypothetical protein [Sinobaca qinghaiensis]RKD68801.1 hypothetical protein ATL39_3263 [Sinobaca qinghaiensis]
MNEDCQGLIDNYIYSIFLLKALQRDCRQLNKQLALGLHYQLYFKELMEDLNHHIAHLEQEMKQKQLRVVFPSTYKTEVLLFHVEINGHWQELSIPSSDTKRITGKYFISRARRKAGLSAV